MPALLRKLERHLDPDAMTVNGRTLGENIAGAECWNDDVIRGEDNPVVPLSRGKTLAVLRGNLAPNGAVMKSSAANPKFLKHVGPALVFDSPAEMNRTIDDPDLDITEDTVIVLRNAGPVGAPGMPEWGNLPIPKKLLQAGRARHGAHLRRAHERHPLRHLHPACRARGGRGRSRSVCSRPETSWSSTWRPGDST